MSQGRQANKATQTGAIRSEDHRQVAGKIDRTNRVSHVMNIGWVKPGFTSIGAGPFWLGADQTHSCTIRIVAHFPVGSEEITHISISKKIRRPMGTIQYADFPVIRVFRDQLL